MEVQRVCLRWEERALPRDWDEALNIIKAQDKGNEFIYSFQGFHNAYPLRTALYIGMTEKNGNRPIKTAEERFYNNKLWGAYRDISIHVGTVTGDKVGLNVLEKLLIISHKPPLNNKHVDGSVNEDEKTVLILNIYEKGVLLPVIFGEYHSDTIRRI